MRKPFIILGILSCSFAGLTQKLSIDSLESLTRNVQFFTFNESGTIGYSLGIVHPFNSMFPMATADIDRNTHYLLTIVDPLATPKTIGEPGLQMEFLIKDHSSITLPKKPGYFWKKKKDD